MDSEDPTLLLISFMSFEVALQSCFQLSLTVPVDYRSCDVTVFNLIWSLSHTLGHIPKQLNSRKTQPAPGAATGLTPNHRLDFDQKDLDPSPPREQYPFPHTAGIQRWALPCSLSITEEILVSFFKSAY